MTKESAYTSDIGEVGATYLRELHGGHNTNWLLPAAAGLQRASERIGELLRYNNEQVEKRRAATALLREAAEQFRFYEAGHWAKVQPAYGNAAQQGINHDAADKAERNAKIATRIEEFLSEVHR